MNHSGFEGACFVCGATAVHAGLPQRSTGRRAVLAATAGIAGAAPFTVPRAAAIAQQREPARGPVVLQPDWVLAHGANGPELLRGAAVVVRGEIIEAVVSATAGQTPAAGGGGSGDARRRVPMPGQILLPGFISGHTHVCSGSPTRGIIEGGRSYARPLELVEALPDEQLDALTRYNLAERLHDAGGDVALAAPGGVLRAGRARLGRARLPGRHGARHRPALPDLVPPG